MGNDILKDVDLEHIKMHKYTSAGYSWLDNKMNPFWIKSANLLPKALSPNMVTIIGIILLSLGVVVILPFDTTLSSPLPNYIYILFAFLVFAGQTMDAIDGKHARNTGRSSPLGQLMDHGCDSFSNSFIIIMVAQAHLLGNSIYTLLFQVLVQLPFYIFSWEEHYTGVLLTHLNNMGVTEFQFIGMGILLLPVFFGNGISTTQLFFKLNVAEFLVIVNGLFALKTSIERIFLLLKSFEDIKKKLYPLLSLFLLLGTELLCYYSKLYQTHPIYIIILNGMFFGFQASKLIVCTMAKRPVETVSWDNVYYFAAVALSVWSQCFHFEVAMFSLCAIVLCYRYISFMLGITFRLLKYLNISF